MQLPSKLVLNGK